ncbi:MAG: hypothetical protein Tsb0013_10940 [Phycisphaerales bacterium]
MGVTTRPHQPRWRRLLLHPLIGVALLVSLGFHVVSVHARSRLPGHTLHLVEWWPNTGRAVHTPVSVGCWGWLRPVAGGGAVPELYEAPALVTFPGDPSAGTLGSISAFRRDATLGWWAPTRRTTYIDAQYTPRHPSTLYGNSVDDHRAVLAQINGALRDHPEIGASIPGGLERYVVAANHPTIPAHDFSRQWWTRGAVLASRVLWWGYLENALALAVLVWTLLCAREAWIVKPWRALYRAGHACWHCGYDLRNTEPGEPCPECGATPE